MKRYCLDSITIPLFFQRLKKSHLNTFFYPFLNPHRPPKIKATISLSPPLSRLLPLPLQSLPNFPGLLYILSQAQHPDGKPDFSQESFFMVEVNFPLDQSRASF